MIYKRCFKPGLGLVFSLIFCAGPGNADEKKFVHQCDETIPPSTPTERFILHKKGTAKDQLTGLVWMRCSLGQIWNGKTCEGQVMKTTWQGALEEVRRINARKEGVAGSKAWRLPNIKELNTLIERQCMQPAINIEVFPNTSNWYYWSSTPAMDNMKKITRAASQWGTDFTDGMDSAAHFTRRRVRLVHDDH